MKNKILAIVLCLTMVLTSGSFAFAADEAVTPQTETAIETVANDEPVVEPVEDELVGTTAWVITGIKMYKNYTDSDDAGKQVDVPVNIKVVSAFKVDGVKWYEVKLTGVSAIFLQHLKSYKYVKADGVSEEEPDEEDTPTTPEEPTVPEEGLDIPYIQYDGSAGNGVDVNVAAPEGAFPEGTTMTISNSNVSDSEVALVVDETILGVVSVDIDFGGIDPTEDVMVYLDIPSDKIPANANKVVIVHMAKDGPEVVGSKYLDTTDADETISFSTNGFSSYAAVFVNGKYSSQKMSSILAGNERYHISTFPVDLFDYNPVGINNSLDNATSDKKGFHFTGYGVSGCSSNSGINNSSAEFAKQGILQDTLVDGLPVIKYLNGTDAGKNTGKILFDANTEAVGKTIYDDIPFEFIYDSQTGYYEYKSSANHAQLNESGTKIELYADTLSTENVYLSTVDLTTASGLSDMTISTKTSTSFKATASDLGNNNRLDPYVGFSVDNVAAANVGQIYVKAKVPSSVGANQFQLFFKTDKSTSFTEDKSFGTAENSKAINYTANGDWIEFVIDTSDNSKWKDAITSIRVDLFDSNKGSVAVSGSYSIEIAQISFIKKGADQYTTRGGFYPFSEIEDSYPGNNTAFSLDTWSEVFSDDGHATARASRSIFNPIPSSESVRYEELAYGLVSEFDFYLPVNKEGLDHKPLTYYFDGDDDLWVFVDNKLVLDIGGGHGAITGSINFTNGTWQVANATTVTGYNSGATTAASAKSGSLDSNLYEPGKHTMKIFYLERGGSVSNCFMKFNLPRTPQGSVKVTKEVVKEDGGTVVTTDSVLKNEEYTFNIKCKDLGSNAESGEAINLANQEFYITDEGENSRTAATDANGNFVLKDGEYATFIIDENHEITVTETVKDVTGYDNKGTTVNGSTENSATLTTAENETQLFEFINKYDEQEVTIRYEAVNPSDCPDAKKGTVELTGSDDPAQTASETVGARVGTPVGSTAEASDAVKFVGWYSDAECTTKVGEEEVYMPERNGTSGLWETKTYYAKFEYMYGDVKITKKGISDLDHHAATLSDKKEQQANLFNITGTSNSGVSIDKDFAINGNDYVIIKKIPVGTYTVKEIINWPWRYTPEDSSLQITVTDGATTEVTFDNERTNQYWLNGGAYVQNVFN